MVLDDWANGGYVDGLLQCSELVLWGVCCILRNEYGIYGQNYVALLKESKMSAGLHSGNLILVIECCRIITLTVVQ